MEKLLLTPGEVCDYTIEVGVKKAKGRKLNMFLLGIMAGVFISIGAFSSTVASHSIKNFGVSKLVAGFVFPVGLILVLICGAELFTGNNLLSIAYLEKRITFKDFISNWILVFIGNFVGAILFALLIYHSGAIKANGGMVAAYALKTTYVKESLSIKEALLSGILCNIIVCSSVWGSYASKDITGKVFMAFFPIMAFVISGFEHCVANMYYLSLGHLCKGNLNLTSVSTLSKENLSMINGLNLFKNISIVTLGNIIGGAIFIGITYWFIYKRNK